MQLPARFATSLLLLLFGFTFILSATLPTAEIGSWSPGPNMAHARANASAVVLDDGSLFVSGGDGANGPLASAEIFSSGSFSSAGSMSVARSHHASVQLQDGRVLVTGGNTTGGGVSNQAEIFDPADGSWSRTLAKQGALVDCPGSRRKSGAAVPCLIVRGVAGGGCNPRRLGDRAGLADNHPSGRGSTPSTPAVDDDPPAAGFVRGERGRSRAPGRSSARSNRKINSPVRSRRNAGS